MKRTQAEREAVNSIMGDLYDYRDLVEVMVKDHVSSWDDDQLADFLWRDDDSQTIEPD